mgnify:CR=1 FL=1
MIFNSVYEYYMWMGTEDGLKNKMRHESFFVIKTEVSEKCIDAYMFGFLIGSMA